MFLEKFPYRVKFYTKTRSLGRLRREGSEGKVLRIDRPDGRRVLRFDGAFGPEGCGLPLCGNAYKVSVTELAL